MIAVTTELNAMSDGLSSNQLRLEVLPDEIFLEIFQYVDPIDLHRFKGLNKRLDHIIQVLKVNIAVLYQEEDDLDYISSFAPTQIVRLEMRNYWLSLNLNTMTELRSLTLDCIHLSQGQLDQVAEISLPRLERLSIDNVTYALQEPLLYAIFRGERFPSLTTCQLKLRHHYNLELNDGESSPNNALRSLAIDKWNWFDLASLLHQLPNLRRFETNFEESCTSMINCVQPHLSIKHLRVTLSDPLHDLEKLLKLTPNLARLRVRGNLGRSLVINYFEKMAEYFPTVVPLLQNFDCELYCYSYNDQENQFIIQQLHPLFNRVRCLFGRGHNECYATDIRIYPVNNEYEESSPQRSPNHFCTQHYHYYLNEDDESTYNDDYEERYQAWERNEYGNGPNMYWDAESDEWCPLP